MLSRRSFITTSAGGVLAVYLSGRGGELRAVAESRPGTILPATAIPQFRTPLPKPTTMPRAGQVWTPDGLADSYDIAARQVRQQVLPAGMPSTTLWAYGPSGGGITDFTSPSMTIETRRGTPVRVRWANELVDSQGAFLPHLFAVDPTLHWANPGRLPGHMGTVSDSKPDLTGRTYVSPDRYTDPATQYTAYQGPVPMVAHLHGAEAVGDESDGYPEAWVLPLATDIPDGYARHGRWFDFFAGKAGALGMPWREGAQVCHYPNVNRPSTLWFHDHALGLTRLNVYAGPVGFYLVREGADDDPVRDTRSGAPAVLPGQDDPAHELSLVIQDRTFSTDGSLYYPDSRAFFDGYEGPYEPQSPVPPIWNPEFFGSTITVNGVTWPTVTLERRRYRLRLLNGCGSRALVLDLGAIPGAQVWQIGNDGGYLPGPVDLGGQQGRLTLAPAERAEVVLDLTKVKEGAYVLPNLGPDGPYRGGPVGSFTPADPATTGRVLQVRVVSRQGLDTTTPPAFLGFPRPAPLPASGTTRRIALMEHLHDLTATAAGPTMAMLGHLVDDGGVVRAEPQSWMDPVTESPAPGATETWEVYNFTEDAHPVHLHQVTFEVVGRAEFQLVDGQLTVGRQTRPAPGERGRKDTVVALPGQVTRLRATFTRAGQYVWHCHVLEHEDNEMMRPYRVGPVQPGQPG